MIDQKFLLLRNIILSVGISRMRPSWTEFRVPFEVIAFGVKWQLYEPEVFVSIQPWAEGPYCPKCDMELEEKNKGHIFIRNLWICPECKENFDRPKGDLKDQVEKNFVEQLKRQRLY
jgi:ribosomal protein L37AE/L43A